MTPDLAFATPAAHHDARADAAGCRVCLLCDDPAAALPWQHGLIAEGIGCSARDAARDADADAIVLLVNGGLPPQLGRLRELRSGAPGLPLVVACSGLRELDQIIALELGADDVVDATLSPPVVAARLRALWRRRSSWRGDAPRPRRLQFGALVLALDERRAWLDARDVDLTEGEFEVLWLLALHAGQTVTRSDILKRVRGLDDQPLDRSIDSRIYRIRAKLGDREAEARGRTPRIRTVRNRGYVFSPAEA